MAFILCDIIAYIQILSAGYNLWGVDPRILVNAPFGRNTFFIGLFLLVQILGLAGAILLLQKTRIGLVLSIIHHILLLPALVVTGWGLVMLMDDRINFTLMFMSTPSGSDLSFYWSLGWNTVFQQVTPNKVPNGSTYMGLNLFALACVYVLWKVLREADAVAAEYAMEARRRRRQGRPRLPPPLRPPEPLPQEQRMRAQQGARQPQRMPPRGY